MILQVSRFLCNAKNLVEISALLSLDSVVVAAHLSTDIWIVDGLLVVFFTTRSCRWRSKKELLNGATSRKFYPKYQPENLLEEEQGASTTPRGWWCKFRVHASNDNDNWCKSWILAAHFLEPSKEMLPFCVSWQGINEGTGKRWEVLRRCAFLFVFFVLLFGT